jgi:hypothetical protein
VSPNQRDDGGAPVTPLHPMTREQAFVRARGRFGVGSVVGVNEQYPDAPLHVGKKAKGDWLEIGFGKTWEEAFADVKKVEFQRPNGTIVFVKDPDEVEKK